MRAGLSRQEVSVAAKEQRLRKTQDDLRRYLLFIRENKTAAEIADLENVELRIITDSIKRGQVVYQADQHVRLRDAKYESAIDNEKIRASVRKRVANKIVDGIDTLLSGTRVIVETNKLTGEVTFHDVVDPDMIALGLEAACKAISLHERPMPNQTIVNIQNNQGDGAMRPNELTFEERIDRIHAQQTGQPVEADEVIPASRQIIESTAVDVTPPEDTEKAEDLF